MIHSNNNTTYYINPAYLTFVEDSGYGANLIQVSASSSCYIRVFIPGEIGYDADGNYRRWKITAYNNKFPDNDAFYIYVRLERDGTSALIVYSKTIYNTDGSSADGSASASDTYYYIRIGEVSATDGTSIREISYDTGRLESDQVKNEGTEVSEMWELDKISTPWLIKAKQWLSSFTVKGFITLVGGLIFKKGEEEKVIEDIKRSTDSDESVPVGDDNLTTSKYVGDFVEQELEKLEDRFLSKLHDDETPYSLGVGGELSVGDNLSVGGNTASKDFAEGTIGGGYATRKNGQGKYESEADIFIARVLSKVYDLLVENDAAFKGNLSSEEFVSGFLSGKGWSIRMKEWINAAGETERKSVAEFDDIIVRGAMRVYEFIVSQLLGENDNRIYTGMMEVDHYDASDGRIYLRTDGGRMYNPFRTDDVIIVQQYGGNPSEGNGYYVTKQYEFIVTAAGVGDPGEDRLDWVEFRNFSTSMEVEGDGTSLIAERDTLVRLDNVSDPARKGIIQMMSVGEDTPYMDFVYGAKTDPENSLKARFGNIGGVYNPLFGWLRDFGAYLTNLYAVGEFVIAHTGENVADSIEISRGLFRTNYQQTTYDLTEEDDFFTNASFTNGCEHWILGEDMTEYYLVEDLPEFFNFELYSSEESYSGLAEWKGRNMLRLYLSTLMQKNGLIDKPGTHKVYTGTTENADGSYTDLYEEVPDILYLSVRLFVDATGEIEFGFADADGAFHENSFHYKETLESQEDSYEIKLSGTWDGSGDFVVRSSGDVYVDLLSLTDRPLENFKVTTETKIEQDANRISLLGRKVNGVEGSVTELGLELDAAEERITAYVDKEVDGVKASVSQLQVDVNGISAIAAAFTKDADGNYILTSAAGAVITSEVASLYATKETVDSLGGRVTAAEASIKVNADNISMKVSENGVVAAINATSETVTISANRIDLNGVVTSTAFNSALSGYATDSELSNAQAALNQSINDLNTTLSAQINAKASIESLDQKVSELNAAISGKVSADSLGSLAYIDDVRDAACGGSTLVVGGYLNTDLISVKKILAVEGTIGGFTITEDRLTVTSTFDQNIFLNPEYTTTIKGDGVTSVIGEGAVTSVFGVSLFSDEDNSYLTALSVVNNQSTDFARYDSVCALRAKLTALDYGLFIDGGSTHILSSNVTKIYGLALRAQAYSGTASSNMDFIRMTGDLTLPAPSSVPGKLYFVKGDSSYTLTAPKCVDTNNSYSTTAGSKTWTDNRTRLFISDGVMWHEFYTTKE